jgi:hypothetical protein
MCGERKHGRPELVGGGSPGGRCLERKPTLDAGTAVLATSHVDNQPPDDPPNLQVFLNLFIGVVLFDDTTTIRTALRALRVVLFVDVLHFFAPLPRVATLPAGFLPLLLPFVSSKRGSLALGLPQFLVLLILPFDHQSEHLLKASDVGTYRWVALRKQLVWRPGRQSDRRPHATMGSAHDRRCKTPLKVIGMIRKINLTAGCRRDQAR